MKIKQSLILFLTVLLFLTGCNDDQVTNNNVFLRCVESSDGSVSSIRECERISGKNKSTPEFQTQTLKGFI